MITEERYGEPAPVDVEGASEGVRKGGVFNGVRCSSDRGVDSGKEDEFILSTFLISFVASIPSITGI